MIVPVSRKLFAFIFFTSFLSFVNSQYCPATSKSAARYISNVKFLGTLSPDTSNDTDFSKNGYGDYRGLSQKAKQIPGGVINVNINLKGSVDPPTATIKAWIDWNKDGTFNIAAINTLGGEKVFDTSDNGVLAPNVIFGFVVPQNAAPGLYTIRVRASTDAGIGPCSSAANGETEDYTFEIIADCSAKITSVNAAERCGAGEVTLSANASAGTESYRWYNSEYGGPIPGANGSSYTVPNLTIGKHTYYVTAVNGTCESAYRTPVKITVRPTPEITFIQSSPDFCGSSNTVIISSTGNKEEVTLFDEKFEKDSLQSEIFENISEGDTNPDGMWKLRSSPFIPGAPYNIVKAALSSGYNGGNFANIITDVRQTTSIVNHFVTKKVINTTGFTGLKLDYDLYYFSEEDLLSKNYLKLQYSLDNGVKWVDLQTFIIDEGVPSRFKSFTIELPASLENQTQLKFRFSVFALGTAKADGSVLEWIVDVVGLDNVRLYGNKDLPANFLWSGNGELLDNTCNIKVAPGGAPSVCVRLSDNELENLPLISITAAATLSNGCTAAGTITIPNSSKIWNHFSTDWASTNWKPATAIPTANSCVIVKTPLIIGDTTNGIAKNITVQPPGTLGIQGSLKVTDWVRNLATAADVVVESDGSLVQVNEGNAINTGSITAKRTINLSPGRQQYNYIHSPVEGQILKTIYNGIDYVLYHNEANNFFYNSSGAYIKGRALAVKEPNKTGVPGTPASVTATFTGYPTNGAFTYGVVNSNTGNMAKRGFNLVGNPYPSNMDLIEFYKINGGESGNIISTFHLWDNRANSQMVQMGDKYEQQAYATFNAVDDTGILATGDAGLAGTNRPDRYLKMGQGFMLQSKVASQQIKFNNTVRTTDNGTVSFFGKGAKKAETSMDRYWLNMITPGNLAMQIAMVYFDGGNNAFTDDDSYSMGGSDALYSIVEGKKVSINGRSRFTDSDVIPLGAAHFAGGNYTIAIADKEGVFVSGQSIYLIDKQTGVLTDLSQGNYTFAASAGESSGRFEIVYKPEIVLATDGTVKEEIQVYRDGNRFVVKTRSKKISGLEVYDASGKLISTQQPNSTKAVIEGASLANGMYLIQIHQNGEVTSRKVLK